MQHCTTPKRFVTIKKVFFLTTVSIDKTSLQLMLVVPLIELYLKEENNRKACLYLQKYSHVCIRTFKRGIPLFFFLLYGTNATSDESHEAYKQRSRLVIYK